MPNKTVHNVLIIGSGPAGLTAAIYAARAGLEPVVIEGKEPGGQLMGTTQIENWPGSNKTMGPQLMANMREHALSFDSQMLAQTVISVDFSKKPLTVTTNKESLQANSVIVATGATPRRLGCPGENEYWGKGVSTCAVCDGAFYKDQTVIIVGGGDTAMEDASFMTKFTDNITIVHILDKFTASHAMQQRVLSNPKIKILYEHTVSAIHGDGQHITGVTIVGQKSGQEQQLPTNALFLGIGLTPNTKPFQGQLKLDKYGYIEVTNNTTTSADGVFVAGDVADYRYRQAITSAGSGCMAALDAQRYLEKINP